VTITQAALAVFFILGALYFMDFVLDFVYPVRTSWEQEDHDHPE
jgi:hypothetical protein